MLAPKVRKYLDKWSDEALVEKWINKLSMTAEEVYKFENYKYRNTSIEMYSPPRTTDRSDCAVVSENRRMEHE